jgi:hypothetical protein
MLTQACDSSIAPIQAATRLATDFRLTGSVPAEP